MVIAGGHGPDILVVLWFLGLFVESQHLCILLDWIQKRGKDIEKRNNISRKLLD